MRNLFACEMIDPQGCEAFGFPQSGTSDSTNDNCICCCTHIVVMMPSAPIALLERVYNVTPLQALKPELTAFPIYHPPKL